MFFVFKETFTGYSFSLFPTHTALISDSTLLISNDNFDTRFENSFFKIFFIVDPFFRVGAYNFYSRIASESLRDLLNVLCEGRITQ